MPRCWLSKKLSLCFGLVEVRGTHRAGSRWKDPIKTQLRAPRGQAGRVNVVTLMQGTEFDPSLGIGSKPAA